MAEIRLTKEQQDVVDSRDGSLLVAAAAGSGKTAVLVQRILKKITDETNPQDIDRLLIVTFTNAAAAEMRERISAAVETALLANPDSAHLQRQMLLLHGAQITTIHSFCLSVIREHFHLLTLDPGFRIGEEAELALLKSDVLEETAEQFYERQEEDFLVLAQCFGSVKSDKALLAYVGRLYEYALSNPWPEQWLKEVCGSFSVSEEEFYAHPMFEEIMEEAKSSFLDCRRLIDTMLALAGETDGPQAYRDCFLSDKERVEELECAAGKGCAALSECLAGLSFARLPSKRQPEADEAKKERAKAYRAEVKEIISRLKKDFFYEPPEEMYQELIAMGQPVRALVRLTTAFMEAYRAEKEKKNLLDFSDLEHLALSVLVRNEDGKPVPTEAARLLAGRYDEIMVDEYQDSNLIQEYILNSISGEWDGKPNMFMVGDVKQSIYRFRMAKPQLFLEKYKTYKEQGSHKKIDLHKNFRSRESVLSSINVLFAGLMHEKSAEIEYDEAAALYCGASYPQDTQENWTEVLFVEVPQEGEGGSSGSGQADPSDGGSSRFGAVSGQESKSGVQAGGKPDDASGQESKSNAQTRGKSDALSGQDDIEEMEFDGMPDGAASGTEELDAAELTAVRAEALAAAKRIKELSAAEFPVQAKEGMRLSMRPVRYSDIVILLRTMSGWSETFLEVLTEQGIPAYADTSTGYFKAVEVQKTLNFLRILDNPKQDIPFAAVLHSPIADFSAEELAQIRIHCGIKDKESQIQRSLYEAARDYASLWCDLAQSETEQSSAVKDSAAKDRTVQNKTVQNRTVQPEAAYDEKKWRRTGETGADTLQGEQLLAKKLAHFFELYDRMRAEAEYISIHELIEHFYEYSGYLAIVSVMPGGERRRGNLRMLVARAKQYETTSYSGLYDFVRYMDKLMKYEVDFGEAKTADAGDMVRIMSIHKSKGLEFPVVILSGMAKNFNRKDMRERMIFHAELGIGTDFIDRGLHIKTPTLLKKVIASRLSSEMISEELRILYVAMTRAKEKLILTGALKKPEDSFAVWEERAGAQDGGELLKSHLHRAECYFDFIAPLLWQTPAPGNGCRQVTLSCTAGTQTFCSSFLLRNISQEELVWQKADRKLEQAELFAQLQRLRETEPSDDDHAANLCRLLERMETYCYPWEKEAKLPTKRSVSELKRDAFVEEEEAEELEKNSLVFSDGSSLYSSIPAVAAELTVPFSGDASAFLSEEPSYPEFLRKERILSAADRGTLYHHVMELLPFTGYTEKSLEETLTAFVQNGRLREEERAVVSVSKLFRFFTSELGKRMCLAAERGSLRKEQPFVLGIPAEELYPEAETKETVLIQGMIDAFFEEDGALVLMDYKTDYIHQDAKKELTEKYAVQLKYYRRALEQLYGLPVKEMWFYSFFKDIGFMLNFT